MKIIVGGLVLAATLGLAGCQSDDTKTTGNDTPAVVASPTPTPTKTVESRCVKVSAKRIADLSTGLDKSAGLTIASAQAVKSTDFKNVYMIAALLNGPGVKNQVGVWASNSLEEGGFFSVDGFALEFSDWADGPKSDANITLTSEGVDEAKDCAKG